MHIVVRAESPVFVPSSRGATIVQSSAFQTNPFLNGIDWSAMIISQLPAADQIQIGLLLNVFYSHNTACAFRITDIIDYSKNDKKNISFIKPYFGQLNYLEFFGQQKERKHISFLLQSLLYLSRVYSTISLALPSSFLLVGPEGIGRRSLLRCICSKSNISIFIVNLSSVLKDVNLSKDYPNLLFLEIEKARLNPPSIVLLEDMGDVLNELKRNSKDRSNFFKLLNKELTRLAALSMAGEEVGIVGLVNYLDLPIPVEFERNGFFNEKVIFEFPNCEERLKIINSIINYQIIIPTNFAPSSDVEFKYQNEPLRDAYLRQISELTTGFTINNLKILIGKILLSASSTNEIDWSRDIIPALSLTTPHQKSEFQLKNATKIITLSEIGGYKNEIYKLSKIFMLRLKNPDNFIKLGIEIPNGVLLVGPTGCGKSMLVRAVAAKSGLNLLEIYGHQVFSKYLGEAENQIRKVFKNARRMSPSLIFIDDIENIGSKRDSGSGSEVADRVLSTLLNEMDGITESKNVMVVACSNRLEIIDEALLRPGRLDVHIDISLPTLDDRRDILIKSLGNRKSEDVDIDVLARLADGFSGSDLVGLIRDAAMYAMESSLTEISHQNILKAFKTVSINLRKRSQI